MERTLTTARAQPRPAGPAGPARAPRASIPEMLDAMGALQAQYAPSMYIGLWSRIADFERDALTGALERRSVIQATLMRVTIHLVLARRLLAAAGADPRGPPGAVAARDKELDRGRDGGGGARRCARALEDGPLKRKAIDELRRQAGRARGRPLGRPGAGPAVGHVGAPPRGPLRARRGLARAGRRSTPDAALDHLVTPLPDRLRPGRQGRDRQLGRPRRRRRSSRRWNALDAAPLRGRGRHRAARPRPDLPLPGRRTRPRRCASCRPGTPSCSRTRAAR